MSDATTPRALATLMARIIDYAGLFPPAALDMPQAVAAYAACAGSADAWALGRFVVPAARLGELERSLGAVPGGEGTGWELSVLATLPLDDDLELIEGFERGQRSGRSNRTVRVGSIETRAVSGDEIARAAERAGPDREVYFEVPVSDDIADLCSAARACGRALKFRTGGTTLDAFPPSTQVARALGACARAGVPFKATAGLHHPLRSRQPITYEPSAPTATMHGFLNVFVAAVLLFTGADEATATRVLEDELEHDFAFDADGLRWREHRVGLAQIAASRRFARSFGSCSLAEPLEGIGRRFHG